jgi:Tfp pilus assembly protein PilF
MNGVENRRQHHKLSQTALLPISISALLATGILPSFADGEPFPIQKLSINADHQIVIQYGSHTGSFPTKPNVQDFPGASHRVVMDFPDAVIDRTTMPSAASTLAALTKVFPDVKGIRYAAVNGTASPTARIVLDIPTTTTISPSVVKLEQNTVTINLGLTARANAEASEPAPNPAATPVAAQPPVAKPEDVTAGTRIQPPSESPQPSLSETLKPTPPAVAEAPPQPAVAEAPASPAPADLPRATEPTDAPTTPPSAAPETSSKSILEPAPAETPQPEVKQAETKQSEPETKPFEAKTPEPEIQNDLTGSKAGSGVLTAAPSTFDQPESKTSTAPEKVASEPVATKDIPGSEQMDSTKDASAEATKSPSIMESPPASTAMIKASDSTKPDDTSKDTIAAAGGATYNPRANENAPPPAESEAPVSPSVAAATTAAESASSAAATAIRAEAEKHFKAAVRFHMSGNLAAAVAEYKATIAINPQLAEPYCNMGLIYNQEHNYKDALDEFHRALAVNPKDAITYNGIGAALRAQKDLVGAIKNWQTAVTMDPNLSTAHYNLGTAYELEKEYDKAMECYRQAVKRDSRLGEAYYRMGLILQKRNATGDALEEFNRALKASAKAEYSDDARQRVALLSKKATAVK